MSDPLAFARLKIRQAVTNLSDSHSWHLTHHGMPPEAEQRRGDQSAPFFGSDDKEIREFITANFSAQLKRADIGRHLGLLAKRVSQTRRPESQRADSGDVGDIVAQVRARARVRVRGRVWVRVRFGVRGSG